MAAIRKARTWLETGDGCFRMRRTKTAPPMLWMAGLVLVATIVSPSQVTSSTAEIKSPDLNLILQRLEEVPHQDPAQSRPYKVIREYKLFHSYGEQPTSEVMAEIDFIPPNIVTYKIIKTIGSLLGERLVREVLDSETDSVSKKRLIEINRANYDFVFLRRQNFGIVPEYVLAIFPKRKEKGLLRGQIWVDATSFRVRRIEGVPAKNPSFWIKDIHMALQFAKQGGMWLPMTFDGIATVRFLGEYTLTGLNTQPTESLADAHK